MSTAIRQLDVCPNPELETRDSYPYIVVLQSDALRHIATRVVAPLGAPRKIQFLERLLPEVTVKGTRYVIAIPELGAVPLSELKAPIANLESHRDRIVAALDLVFTGI